MVWRWPIRKRGSVQPEAARGERTPSVHETPTREFVAYIPADEGSVHDKPTREFVAYSDPNAELAAAPDPNAQLVSFDQSGPVGVRSSFEDEGTAPRGLKAPPSESRHKP